jgi:hypothetical protein
MMSDKQFLFAIREVKTSGFLSNVKRIGSSCLQIKVWKQALDGGVVWR